MKNFKVKWINMLMALFMFGLVAACNNAQEQTAAETEESAEMEGMEMGEMAEAGEATAPVIPEGEPAILVNYAAVKNALFQDDFAQVKEATVALAASLGKSDKLNQDQIRELQTATLKIAEAENIKVQRRFFAELSQELYQAVQNNKLSSQVLYWQHCPMALEGQGANWLSYEEQIQNPFMGQRMPKCGSVAKTLNQ